MATLNLPTPAGVDVNLTIEIKNEVPVELTDLTKSFLGLADEYRRFVAKHEHPLVADDIRLYVKEIRPGSIIAVLQPYALLALPIVENSNTVIEFCGYLKTAYDYFTGKRREKPLLEKANFNNLSNIIEPIAKDNGSQINITGTINFNAPVTLNINSLEANAAQNALQREIAALREPSTGIHEKVLLYWYQARNDPTSQKGDRSIIESVYPSSVKTVFATESVKAKMIYGEENPFKYAFVVDVAVETINGRPALYKIIAVYDKISEPLEFLEGGSSLPSLTVPPQP